MENCKEFRQDVLVNGLSQRAASAKYKLGWYTLKKNMAHAEQPGCRQSQTRSKRVLAAEFSIIQEILEVHQKAPTMQRHTVKRIMP
jgi:transposase